MKPSSWLKQPWEVRQLEFNPANSIITGDSLYTITNITIWEDSVEVTNDMINGTPNILNNKIYVVLKAGVAGHTYNMRLRIETTNGDLIEDDLRIIVTQVGT
jgi:hypothetical protein